MSDSANSPAQAVDSARDDGDSFSLFDAEREVLREADVMVGKLEDVGQGVRRLAEAYRRSFRELQRMVRLSDRMQLELHQANKRLAEQADHLTELNHALENEIAARTRLTEELEHLVRHDALTGAFSRAHLLELAERERVRAARAGTPLACILMDLDHFKQINDTYGHASGDVVLRRFVRLCRESLREVDVFGRLGGEEFAAFLPDTDAAGAREVAERIRERLAGETIETPDGRPMKATVTLGLSIDTGRQTGIEQLLSRADNRLYEAKNAGRNRIAGPD
ncbi:GGDEF domain-containing protein [Roseospirillum parvum]|uniref:diguanylate cyclase n=1 Tax=Roseospirillum parvum TaxID=83401 RepID=A0A1G7WN23_9PROT|nr:GGDEF domain-containing protein [Roseospirillum parvum]SDG73371.1 diguanylate cyclase (GGDEF) domain-containing protein [Roseospirillum parvum]